VDGRADLGHTIYLYIQVNGPSSSSSFGQHEANAHDAAPSQRAALAHPVPSSLSRRSPVVSEWQNIRYQGAAAWRLLLISHTHSTGGKPPVHITHGEHSIDALLPAEMATKAEEFGVKKLATATMRTLVLAVLAGAFIALGAVFSTTVTAGA